MAIQRKQHTFTIHATTYGIHELDPDEMLFWIAKLSHIIAGGTLGLGVSPAGMVERTPINFGSMIRGVIDRVQPNELPQLIRLLLSQSLILPDYKEENFPEMFRGKTSELLELVYKIFEINFETISESQKKTITNIIGPFLASYAQPENAAS